MHCTLPPSPSFSSPDSLAGIDDLDAFLAAQGDLSRFPTPPPPGYTPPWKKDGVVVTAVEILDDHDHDDNELVKDEQFSLPNAPLEDSHLADLFSSLAGHQHSSTFYETVLIQDMLARAQLPPEILGLSYNILTRYNESETTIISHDPLLQPAPSPSLAPLPADLLLTATFALATDFLQDHAPPAHFWSRHITWDLWPPARIAAAKADLLHRLDWRLLSLATPAALQTAVAKLHRAPARASVKRTAVAQPFRLQTDAPSFSTSWAHGLMTPEATPPCSAVDAATGWASVVWPFV